MKYSYLNKQMCGIKKAPKLCWLVGNEQDMGQNVASFYGFALIERAKTNFTTIRHQLAISFNSTQKSPKAIIAQNLFFIRCFFRF